jgi:hypothetical protein
VSLQEYEEILSGGPAGARWLDSTRTFLRHVRTFYLIKEGAVRADSRGTAGLACEIRASLAGDPGPAAPPTPLTPLTPLTIDAIVTNTGSAAWLPWGTAPGGVGLGAHLYDASGTLLSFDFHVAPLTIPPREIAPGETVTCRVVLPAIAPGRYRLELDCVAANVTWFAQAGSKTVALELRV